MDGGLLALACVGWAAGALWVGRQTWRSLPRGWPVVVWSVVVTGVFAALWPVVLISAFLMASWRKGK